MFFIRFFHFLVGYIVFSAEGGFPERFINLCTVMQIPVWELESRDGVLRGKAPIKAYADLTKAAVKSGMDVNVTRRVGARFFIQQHRRRVGLLAGAVFFAGFIVFMSGIVWTVEVSGNTDTTQKEILDVFEQLGVRAGVRAKNINVPLVENSALAELSQKVQWLAVNINGSAVTIEVREKIKSSPAQDYELPHHIVASRDAVLTVLDAYEGAKCALVGSAVSKGDLLVSGITDNSDGSVAFHHAKGYAQGLVCEKIETVQGKSVTLEHIAMCKKRAAIVFLGLKIPPHIASDTHEGEFYETERRLYASGVRLPIGYDAYRWLVFEEQTFEYSDTQLKLLASHSHLTELSQRFRYCEIITRNVSTEISKSGCKISGSFEVMENIGEELRFYVIENPDGETSYTLSPP